MAEHFARWGPQLGALGYLLLGVAAFLEYVVPPFPGDGVVVVASAWAVRGEKSALLVFAVVAVASLLGISVTWLAGRLVGERVERMPEGRLFFGLVTHARIRELEGRMAWRGSWLLLINRFLPALRSLVFVAAGAARMPFVRVALLGMISAMAWTALLLALGYAVGGSAERLAALHGHVTRVAWIVAAVIVAALVVRFFARRRLRAAH